MRVLSRRFRTLFLDRLRAARAAGELRFSGALANLADPRAFAERLGALRATEWVVYSKRPFAGPEQVLAYLGDSNSQIDIWDMPVQNKTENGPHRRRQPLDLDLGVGRQGCASFVYLCLHQLQRLLHVHVVSEQDRNL